MLVGAPTKSKKRLSDFVSEVFKKPAKEIADIVAKKQENNSSEKSGKKEDAAQQAQKPESYADVFPQEMMNKSMQDDFKLSNSPLTKTFYDNSFF